MSSPNFEIGPPDRDLYLKAGGVPYLKLTSAGVLSTINGGSGLGGTLSNANLVAAGIGAWTSLPFNAADYTSNTGTWTVQAGDAASPVAWCRIGNIVFISVFLTQTSCSSAGVALQIALSAFGAGIGTPVGGNNAGAIWYNDAGTPGSGTWLCTATHIQFYKSSIASAWSNSSDATDIRCQINLHTS